jgi:TrmH family RNA methyltransferase
MISKNQQKYISSLELKKNRKKDNVFVAEGFKIVQELLHAGFRAKMIVGCEEWMSQHQALCPKDSTLINVTEDELRKPSFLQHPQQVLGVFEMPDNDTIPDADWFRKNLCIALDGVQDPGNLGTIIRIADWFGIDTIICSQTTADAYAPKVVQATMGTISRVKIIYTDLVEFLKGLDRKIPIYGTLLDGDNIYSSQLSSNGIIVMGNEGNGISPAIRELVNHRLLIPSYPPERETAESLNVAIATAITVAEFRRISKA